MPKPTYPKVKTRVFLLVYRLIWCLAMPFVLLYLRRRARADALYFQHLPERYGMHRRWSERPIWVHAVSLGEIRSAVPLIQSLLDDGHAIVTTHFTPAGRREAERVFASEIASGRVRVCWIPFDYPLAFRRFFAALDPQYGLVMEVEFWPGMIEAARRAKVPLLLCNGQYPDRSFARDRAKRFSRADIVGGFAGVMVKNDEQADRFRFCGQTNIAVTGELRFDQPVPHRLTMPADAVRQSLAKDRPVIAMASVVEGEDNLVISAMIAARDVAMSRGDPLPVFVYVPRAPERFDAVAGLLADAGLQVLRRSQVLDADLAAWPALKETDVLLGDSMGEMYFYLSLCDRAFVGGGFTRGSHNIIEPLVLRKPAIVGPDIGTSRYPAIEAIEAGICRQVTADTLAEALFDPQDPGIDQIDAFLDAHGTALARTRAAIPNLIAKSLIKSG